MILPDKATTEELDRHLPKRPCRNCAGNEFWQELRWPDSLICKCCWPGLKTREEEGEARSVTFDPAQQLLSPQAAPSEKKKPSRKKTASIDDLWRE